MHSTLIATNLTDAERTVLMETFGSWTFHARPGQEPRGTARALIASASADVDLEEPEPDP